MSNNTVQLLLQYPPYHRMYGLLPDGIMSMAVDMEAILSGYYNLAWILADDGVQICGGLFHET